MIWILKQVETDCNKKIVTNFKSVHRDTQKKAFFKLISKKNAKLPPIREERTSPIEEDPPKQSLGLRGICQRSELSVSPPQEGAERITPMALGARKLSIQSQNTSVDYPIFP
ncbi:hypothetical protein [Anoxybacteroides amylolyticum]|uniref:hypothetical protein n=1 Tax=Anoxybacteroides amylolyticum TaxID=294699 RepID=UPI00082D9CA8|nr:hypothetical protein [Anoxybacillus amylolyticus]